MKRLLATPIIFFVLVQGCSVANIGALGASGSDERSVTEKNRGHTEPSESVSTYRMDWELRSAAPIAASQAPDAVIKVSPNGRHLSEEMSARLLKIVQLAKKDERIMLRLKGYVPDGGSPAWNIGAADKSLRFVKERLEAMRISSRRIQVAAFGEEHEVERDPRRHWVEIYLIRPRK